MTMQKRWILPVLGLALSACTSAAPTGGATVPTAPQTTEVVATAPPATAALTTAAPSTTPNITTPPATRPLTTTAPPKVTWPPNTEEATIASLIIEMTTEQFRQLEAGIFDPTRLSGYTPAFQSFLKKEYQTILQTTRQQHGEVFEVWIADIQLTASSGSAVRCLKNDIQIWDSQSTPETQDDTLLDGDLATIESQLTLEKGKTGWTISDEIGVRPSVRC
jgi:hypothetical protein